MSFRSDVREALEPVTPPAPHLAHVVMDAARRGARPGGPAWRRMAPAVALGVVLLAGGAAVVVAVQPAFVAHEPAFPPPSPDTAGLTLSGDLAVTTWVPDASVTTGPWPGFRPRLVPIDRSMVTSARVAPSGAGWTVVLTLDARGARTLTTVSTAAVEACPASDCAQRHLTLWAGLTQADIDRWAEGSSVLYRPLAVGGLLLTDPQVMAPLPGGVLTIIGNLTQRQAEAVARWLTARG